MGPGLNQLNFESTGLAHETEPKLNSDWLVSRAVTKKTVDSFVQSARKDSIAQADHQQSHLGSVAAGNYQFDTPGRERAGILGSAS